MHSPRTAHPSRSACAATVVESIRGQNLDIKSELGLPLNTVNLEHLRRIMTLRFEELFQLIAEDVGQAGLLDYMRAGVFVCGGGARTRDIAQLAEVVFQMPVCLGRTNSISGLKSTLDHPEFATAIGLVKFGSFKVRKREERPGFFSGIKSVVGRILSKD